MAKKQDKGCKTPPVLAWSDPRHPVWSLCRIALLGVIIFPVLYANASKFDETELRSIVLTIGLFGAADYGISVLKNFTTKGK